MNATASTGDASASSWIANNLVPTAVTVAVISVITCIYRILQYRDSVVGRNGPLPMLPTSRLFGTLLSMGKIYEDSPMDTHPHGTMTLLRRKHGLGKMFFLDNWPASAVPQMCIVDPAIAAQVTQSHSLPKSPELRRYVEHLCGPTSMLFTEGEEWKKTRSLFNPGFSAAHLMTLVPSIVDDTSVYCKVLDKYASTGETFQVEEAAAHLTIDIMGHVVLDFDLNSQMDTNDFVEYFRKSVQWTPPATTINPFLLWNPLLPVMHKYYAWKMDSYLGDLLEARYASNSGKVTTRKGRKPAIDLALDEYALQESQEGRKSSSGLDSNFKKQAIDQMKTFLFAGHDTSSSTICFIYHLLSRHPEAAEKVRKEHDEIFGTNRDEVADRIKQDPSLVNKLPYSLAVIKETLRLYPPASTVRSGDHTSVVHDGKSYPTAGAMVWVVSHSIHRDPKLFPSPDEFIPERFLPSPNNWQDVPKDAWRPFEKGPRSCIGQELAVLEMKIIMAMTCRSYDIVERYEEWDRKMGREKPGDMLGGKRGMFGDRVYQVLLASAKPADGFPGMVKRRA